MRADKMKKPMDRNLPKLLPIILADSSGLDRWPASRICMPAQFQKNKDGLSPFQELFTSLSTLAGLLPPIISLPAASLRPALEQIKTLGAPSSSGILTIPLDRGTFNSATAVALLAQQSHPNAIMIIIDANHPPSDWKAFGRLARQVQQTPLINDYIVACGHPKRLDRGSSICVERSNRTSDPNLYTCRKATSSQGNDIFEMNGVVFSTPTNLLNCSQDFSRRSFNAVLKAVENKEQNPDVVWPNLNIWSSLETQEFQTTLLSNHDNILFRPVDLEQQADSDASESRMVYSESSENCSIEANGHLVAVAGCEDLRIISTKDATLIANKNRPVSLEPILTKLRMQERPEVYDFPIAYHAWGKETQIEKHDSYSITRIEIESGQIVPSQNHNQTTDVLHVLTGKGEAIIGDHVHTLEPGQSLNIPPTTSHALRNRCNGPFVLLETRHKR